MTVIIQTTTTTRLHGHSAAATCGSTALGFGSAVQLRIGCGSAARHGFGLVAAWRAAWLQAARRAAALVKSRSRAEGSRRANDGDRQEVESPNAPRVTCLRRDSERKVESMWLASREEAAARRSSCLGSERCSSKQTSDCAAAAARSRTPAASLW